jgi:hypothetical protein
MLMVEDARRHLPQTEMKQRLGLILEDNMDDDLKVTNLLDALFEVLDARMEASASHPSYQKMYKKLAKIAWKARKQASHVETSVKP